MADKLTHNLSLRAATGSDTAFALQVTKACMRAYADLSLGGGHFAFRIEEGDPPNAALQARIDARLSQFEKAVQGQP